MPIGRLAAEATLNDAQIVEALKRIEQFGGITEQKLNEIVASVRQIGTTGAQAAGGMGQLDRSTSQATRSVRSFREEQRLQNFVVRESVQALTGAVFAYTLITQNQRDATDTSKRLTSAMLSAVTAFNAVEFIGFAVGTRFKSLGTFITGFLAPLSAAVAGFLGWRQVSDELVQTLDQLIDKRKELEFNASLRGKGVQEQLFILNTLKDQLEAQKKLVDAQETTTQSLVDSEKLATAILDVKDKIYQVEGKVGQQEKERQQAEQRAAKESQDAYQAKVDNENAFWAYRKQADEGNDRAARAAEDRRTENRIEDEKRVAEEQKKAAEEQQRAFEDTIDQIGRIGNALQRAFKADTFIAQLSQALQIALQIARVLRGSGGNLGGLDFGEIALDVLGIGALFFDEGGRVPGYRARPRMAVVHEGETVLPTHRYPLHEALSRALSRTGTNSFDAGGVVAGGGGGDVISELRAIQRMLARIEPKTYVVGPTFQDALKTEFPKYDKFEKKKLP